MPGQQTHGAGAEILRGSCCRHRAGVEVGHPGPAGSREQPCSSLALAFQEHQVFQASERGLQAPLPAGCKRPPVTPQHPRGSNWRALALGAAWQRLTAALSSRSPSTEPPSEPAWFPGCRAWPWQVGSGSTQDQLGTPRLGTAVSIGARASWGLCQLDASFWRLTPDCSP